MREDMMRYELSAEGKSKVQAVDGYLEECIRDGRPIEALVATRRLGEIASKRTKEAARAATKSSWSWTDVGMALGVSKQAAHEKLHARVRGEIDKAHSKLEQAAKSGHAKIARRAARGREELDRVSGLHPKVDSARQRVDEWEQRQHDKLSRNVEKGRRKITRTEHSVRDKLDRRS
jgi:hypothetical protein